MYSEGSCSAGAASRRARSISCMGDHGVGSSSFPRTSWRSLSSSAAKLCRSPCCTRRAKSYQACALVNAVTVTTVYESPVPCAWWKYHKRRASSPLARMARKSSRMACSKSRQRVPTRRCTSCMSNIALRELREPGTGGREQLVGHLLDLLVVAATGERVGEERGQHVVAATAEGGIDGELLSRGDAAEVLGEKRRCGGPIAPAYAVAVGDAHGLDHDIGRQVGALARVGKVERECARPAGDQRVDERRHHLS